ncbi:MAG: tetratricopeptide repeat protein, partial [Candidatus Micrarchaeaceae archaeon]
IKEKIENWLSSFKKKPFKGKWKIDYVESKLTQEDVQNLCEYFKKRIGTEKKIDKKKEEYYIHLATFGDLRSGIFIPQLFEEIFTKHFDKTTEELEEYRNMEKERERFFQEALGFSLVGTITAETVIDALKGFLVRLADVPYFGLSEVVLVGILSIVNIYGVGKQLGFSRYMKLYTHWNNFPDAKKRIMCNILDEKYNLPPGSSYDFLSLWLSKRSKNDAESESLFKKNLENVFTEKFLNELRDVIKKYPELDKKLKEQDEKIKEIENNISKIEETLEQIRKNQYTTGLTEIKNENELKDQLSNVPQNIVGISSTEADKRINSIVEECKSQATNKIVVLTGEPGAGKTTLLFLVARSLILDGKLLYYIREPWNFSPTRFQNMKNAYAICDFTELGSNQFFETLRSLQGKNVELGHIIISVRKAYLTKDQWEFINNDKDARFEVKEVKLEEKILLEIAKKEINSKLKDWINNNIDQIADVLVERSEGLPLYISEAVKMLAIKKNEGKVYDDKMLNELPNNVENMINNIINQEIRRDKKLLVTYYLVRHTHGLLKEYLEAFNNIYGIKEPRFLNESSDRLSLHSWYRDVIDHLPNEYYEIGFDTQTTLNSYLEELMNSINNKKKDPVPDLTKSLNDFYNHKDSANFKDVADLVMFGATKYLVERKIKRSDGKYGFNILSERVDYASINSNSIHFYNRLIGFLVNGYLSGETLKEAMSKDIRPFYCLSVFYASRLFQNKIANAVDDVFLKGTGDSSIITLESMIYFKLSSFILGVYITALTNVLEQLKYFQPNESSSKALLNFLKSEYNEALLYVRKSKHIEAVEEYDKAIKLNPNNPDYHIKKGKMLKLKGQFSEALNELTYALELAPEDPLCLITLAEIMACMDKSQEGIKELSSAIKFKPAIKEMLCSIAHSEIKSDSANNKEKLMLKEFIDSYC